MTSDFPVVLDACVLVQAAVRDTLLRLSERRLFLCRWSDEIIHEVRMTLTDKFGLQAEDVQHLISELQTYFPEAWVHDGYKTLTGSMTNHEKDRHVTAAAVKEGCELIVTYNEKHFREKDLQPLGLYTRHPDAFLVDLYHHNPEVVVHVLHEQGSALTPKRTLKEVLASLETCRCTAFSRLIAEKLSL